MQHMHGNIPYMFDHHWTDRVVYFPFTTRDLHGLNTVRKLNGETLKNCFWFCLSVLQVFCEASDSGKRQVMSQLVYSSWFRKTEYL